MLEWLFGPPVPVSTASAEWQHPMSYAVSLSDSYGPEIVREALSLAQGCDPMMNIMPYIQIVLDAKRLGLTVTR